MNNTCLQIKTLQKVSADEQLAAITGISVVRSAFDPRLFNIKVSGLTKGYQPISTAFTVSTI